MPNFDFLDKGLGRVSAAHFVYDQIHFQQKCSSCYILLTDQISLLGLLEILDNMCIAVVC